MLDKVIMLPFSLLMIMLFAFMAVTGLAMFVQWGIVQNQAQFMAASIGRWGGYTIEADRSLGTFAGNVRLNRNQVSIQLSNTGPVPWGTPVWARVTVPFRFKVGQYDVGTFDLTGTGKSISSYLPGAYSLQYTAP